jgi:LCP family protein required for cell wall assembly
MKKRRSAGQRVLRGFIGLVVAVLVVIAAGYGYFRYQWSKVSSAACSTCVAAANGAPYNVLLIGSDSRAGETAAEAKQFGNATNAGGQRSDTIKIVHVDPSSGTASTLSIPRDTYVTLSGLPASSPLSADNKINASFSGGPDALIQTIQNTFGIPISHYIEINFFGLQDAVNALGGVSLDFPYPVRDHNQDTGVNESGLDITRTGCQVLSGSEALALSRSRYFEYYKDGQWYQDGSSDIGRIERQNLIISAALNKAKSTYNPLRLNALLSSVVHDFSKDNGLSPNDLFALAERYHAFSGSQLQTYTMPTSPAYTSGGSAVEVVEPQAASQMIGQFLGGSFGTISTPPLDQYGNPQPLPAVTATTAPAASSPTPSSTGGSAANTAPAKPTIPSFDPHPC